MRRHGEGDPDGREDVRTAELGWSKISKFKIKHSCTSASARQYGFLRRWC